MKAQRIRALQKPPLLLLEPEEVQLALIVQKVGGETDSPELFSTGSLEKQNGGAGSSCPRSLPVSWVRACGCHLVAWGKAGHLPSEQKQPTALGTAGTGCCNVLQEKPPSARTQIYSQQLVGCDPAANSREASDACEM